MSALDIERRVAISLAVGRYLRSADRFNEASKEFTGACKSLRQQLGSQQRFPDVKLVRGARFVEDGKFASAGGVSSGIDLALRVVERYLGTEAAANLADGIEYQGIGWKNSDSNDAYATLPELNESKPLCPLCLMDGDRSIKTIHKGRNFYFCSQGEKEFFDSHLDVYDRFVAEDAMRTSKPKN